MSKRFAVGFFSLLDNQLDIEFITADTWQEAVPLHSKIGQGDGKYCHWLDDPAPTVVDHYMEKEEGKEALSELEAWKQCFFDQDAMFDVKEII